MKIQEGYVVRKIGTKYYAVSVTRVANDGGMIALNETGAFLWELLKEETDMDTLVAALVREYAIDEATARADAETYIGMLKEVGALA